MSPYRRLKDSPPIWEKFSRIRFFRRAMMRCMSKMLGKGSLAFIASLFLWINMAVGSPEDSQQMMPEDFEQMTSMTNKLSTSCFHWSAIAPHSETFLGDLLVLALTLHLKCFLSASTKVVPSKAFPKTSLVRVLNRFLKLYSR